MSNIRELINQFNNVGIDIFHVFKSSLVGEMGCVKQAEQYNIGILLGNTKNIWPGFIHFLKTNNEFLNLQNPFDSYVEKLIEDVIKKHPEHSKVLYAHKKYPQFLPFQQIAEQVQLAKRTSYNLSVHPIYGPWFSLRALIFLKSDAAPIELRPLEINIDIESPCKKAYSKALDSEDWKDWLQLRECCPIGQEYRFGDDQLIYHYTKDKKILKELIK